MRAFITIGLLALAAGACTPTSEKLGISIDQFEHTDHLGTLHEQVEGIGFYRDGDRLHAGMWDTTCEVFSDGFTGMDMDAPDELEGERVRDLNRDPQGRDVVLATTSHAVYVMTPEVANEWDWGWEDDSWGDDWEEVWPGVEEVPMTGVMDAQLTDTGFAALVQDGCQVTWVDALSVAATVALPAGACEADVDFAVDAKTGTAVVAANSGVVAVQRTGEITQLHSGGNLVVWSDHDGVAFVATQGDRFVTAVDLDGAVRWTTELDHPATSLDDMGQMQRVAIMTETPGAGSLVMLDGQTGEGVSVTQTPAAARDIVVSDDGTNLAFVLDYEVHFFTTP